MSAHHVCKIESLETRRFLSAAKLGSISGSVYSDLNLNAAHDAGEAGVRGAYVFLDLNGNGLYDKKTEPFAKSGSRGEFAFTGLQAGTYRLREMISQQTTVDSEATTNSISEVSAPSSGWFKINLAAGQNVVRRQFGNVKLALITAPPARDASSASASASSVAANASAQAVNVSLLVSSASSSAWNVNTKTGTISHDGRSSTAGGTTSTNAGSGGIDLIHLLYPGGLTGGLTFSPSSTPPDTLLKFLHDGDSSLNGAVTGGDYSRIDVNFNNEHSGANVQEGWISGDAGVGK